MVEQNQKEEKVNIDLNGLREECILNVFVSDKNDIGTFETFLVKENEYGIMKVIPGRRISGEVDTINVLY